VAKRFEATRALDELYLGVGPGEVRGLFSRSDAWKTTQLRVLFRLPATDAWWVQPFGRRLRTFCQATEMWETCPES
jgi:ABC-type uncharacterized transport system ATPase subunit